MLPRPFRSRTKTRRRRRGAVLVLVAVMLTVLVALSAFAINVAYMQTARTELRLSTDSAAKAAIIRLHSSQDQTNARNFARTIANYNRVAGQTITYTDAQIEFGNSAKDSNGVYQFTAGATPLNSCRVTGTRNINLIFGNFLATSSFTPTQVSVATRINHDIVLVLDRSGSMAFDLSNTEFSYPDDRRVGTLFQNYFSTPSPTDSRWKALTDAVDVFTSVLNTRQLDAQVALVTYAEAYTFGDYSSTQVSTDQGFTKNYTLLSSAMDAWFNKELIGDTNIEAGLNQAQSLFQGPGARATAQRTVILLTDGVATSGNPDISAVVQNLRTTTNTIVHVITFGGQSASGTVVNTEMQQSAQAGYGNFYQAPSAATLNSAFTEIAQSLPAILTQ